MEKGEIERERERMHTHVHIHVSICILTHIRLIYTRMCINKHVQGRAYINACVWAHAGCHGFLGCVYTCVYT